MKPVVKNRSCPTQVSRFRRCLLSAAIMAAGQALCVAPAWAGPEGGRVTGGDGTIDLDDRTTTVNQNTDRLVVDWDSFNIEANEAVNYIQPGTDSIALNRILSHRGSEIHGQINANGHVVLVNPHGMVFGEGAQVNVGGMIASGLRIASDDFMNGEFNFSALEGTEGAVINRGVIQAATGGSVSMLGRKVGNEGLISANLGAVNLAAGKEAVVTFDDAGLMGVRITKEVFQDELGVEPALMNSGELNAAGGRVLLTASTSRDIFSQAVNTGDVAQADSVVVHDDGSFTLGDGADVVNTGGLNASSATGAAGQVAVLGENITHSGTVRADANGGGGGQVELHAQNTTLVTQGGHISARSEAGQGGDIALLGHWVGLTDYASLNASGASGGGQILMGGDYKGQNTALRNSQRTYVGADTMLQANALAEGDGGRIIIWADDITRYAGHLEARGAGARGMGGFAEVSGKDALNFRGTASLSGQGGVGTLLLDPRDIKIVDDRDAHEDYDKNYLFAHSIESGINFSSRDIAGLLDNDTNIILEATRDISIEAEIRAGGTNTSSLILRAGDDILLDEDTPISLGGGNVSFSAGVASCFPMDCYTGTEEEPVTLDGSSISLDGRMDTEGTVLLRAADNINIGAAIGSTDSPASVSLRAGNEITVASSITTAQVSESNIGTAGATIELLAGDQTLISAGESVPLGAPNFADNSQHLIIDGTLNSQGGDVFLNAGDAVDVNADISTLGGNLSIGDENDGYRPTSFDAQGQTLSTGTASQTGDSGRHAGEITIRTEIRKDEGGKAVEYGAGDYSNTGNVDLGLHDLAVNYEELDSPTAGDGKGGLSVGSVYVVAEGDITLHNDWDFNNTGPYAFDGSGGEGLESASLDLTADGSVTLSGSIYDSYADARESLDITLKADANNDGSGSVVVVGDVFTSGGNFTASGQNLTLPGRIDTHHANLLDGGSEQLGEGWSDGDPQGWSTGGDITLTASGNLNDGTMSLGTLQTIASCIEGAECTGDLKVNLSGPSASDVVTQRADTSLVIAGATTLNLGGGSATLDNAANQLHGADGYVQIDSANDLTLEHTGSLVLDAVNMDGDLDVTTHGEDGSISGSKGLTVGGAADFNTQGNLTLLAPETDDPAVVNSFDGVVSVANAASVAIDNGSDLTLGAITAPGGSVAVTAEGNLTAGGLIGTSGGDGQAGGAINLTATGAALNVVNLKANGGEAEGGNAGGNNGGATTLAGNQIALSGAITSTGSRKGNGGSAESSGTGGKLIVDSNVLLESDVTIDLSSDGGNAGNFELKGTLDSIGTAKGMSIDAGDVTFEDAIGVTNALGAVAVISDGAVALGGDTVPDAESITITGQSDHSQSLTATNTSNIWNLLQNADGSGSGESNTLNDVIKFTGFDTLRGGSADDHFQVQFTEAEFTLIGGSAEVNQLTAFSAGSEWSVLADGFGTLDDNGASTGFSEIQTINGSASDRLQGPDESNTWRLGSAGGGDLNTTLDGSEEPALTLAFTGMDALIGGTSDDYFIMNGGASIGLLRGVTSGEVEAGTNTLLVESESGDTVEWSVARDHSGSLNGVVTDYHDIASLEGGQGADIFTVANDDGDGKVTIDGGTGDDNTFSFDGVTDAVKLSIGGSDEPWSISSIQVVEGNSHDASELKIAGGTNTWMVSDKNGGTLEQTGAGDDLFSGALTFNDFANLVGGEGADTFEFSANGEVTGSIDGGSTSGNTLSGHDDHSVWTIGVDNGAQEGRIAYADDAVASGDYLTSFTSIQSLIGGSGNDRFAYAEGAAMVTTNGGGSEGEETNTLDLSKREKVAITIGSDDLNGVTHIQVLKGNGIDSTLGIVDGVNTWTVNDEAEGATSVLGSSTQGAIDFTGFTQLDGGPGTDTLVVSSVDTEAVQWQVTGNGVGRVDERGAGFSGMNKLQGSKGADTFNLSAGVTTIELDGGLGVNSLQGGNTGNTWLIGVDNTLNGSIEFSNVHRYWGGEDVDHFTLQSGSVPAEVAGGVQPEGASDTLTIQSDEDITVDWTLTGTGAGSVTGRLDEFTGIEKLIGAEGNDHFTLTESGSAFELDGGAGNNELTGFSDNDNLNQWSVTASGGELVNDGASVSFSGINTLTGGDGEGGDRLMGPNASNLWSITSSGGGSVKQNVVGTADPEYRYTFSGMETLEGGTANDRFELTGDGSVETLRGVAEASRSGDEGEDTLFVESVSGSEVGWSITGEGAGSMVSGKALFEGMDQLEGGLGNDTFTVSTTGALSLSLDGGTGDNTLEGANRNNTWAVDADGNSLNTQLTFESIQHLVGHEGDDIFTLDADASLTSVRGAREGATTTGANELTLQSAGGDSVAWELTGDGKGSVAGRVDNFFDLTDLTGGAGNDTFTVSTADALALSLDGASGDNTLKAPRRDNTWVVDAGGNSLNTSLTFEGIQNLVGHEGDDTFTLDADASLNSIRGARKDATTTGANELTLQSAEGDSVVWELTGEDEGSVSGRLGRFYDLTNLTGGEGDDIFTLKTNQNLAMMLDGGAGSNTLNAEGGADWSWTLSGTHKGERNDSLSFDSIQTLIGSDSDTLTGRNQANTWTFEENAEGENQWSVVSTDSNNDTLLFNGMETLIGRTDADQFHILTDSLPEVTLDGGGATGNTLVIDNALALTWRLDSATSGDVNDTVEFSQIQAFDVSDHTGINELQGLNRDTRWLLDDKATVRFGKLGEDESTYTSIIGFDILTGGDKQDDFYILNNENLSFTLNGGEGTNTLYGANRDNTWDLGAEEAGTHTLNSAITFSNMGALVGHVKNDDFILGADASIDTLRGIQNDPDNVTETGINSLTIQSDNNADVIWSVSAADEGTVTDRVTSGFYSIGNLTGGAGDDTFILADGASLSGNIAGGSGINGLSAQGGDNRWTLDEDYAGTLQDADGREVEFMQIETLGGSGSDTLTGRAQPNTWTLNDAGRWSVVNSDSSEDEILFSGMDTLIGNTDADDFSVSAGQNFAGQLDGAGGDNTLVVAGGTNQWTLNETTAYKGVVTSDEEATRVGGFAQIQTLTGTGSDTLTGMKQNNHWRLTAESAGTVGVEGTDTDTHLIFDGMAKLIGQDRDDRFERINSEDFQGTVDGGAGSNTLQAAGSNRWLLTDTHKGKLNDDTDFLNIQTLAGGGDDNRLAGSDQESAWRLTGAREGTVQTGQAQTLTFTGMEGLIGGEGSDSFTVNAGLSRDDLARFDTLHGGDGIGDDTLNLTGLNTDEAVAISLGEHGEALAHLKVRGLETLTGHGHDDNTLMGASEANTSYQWSIDETDSGSVSAVDDASGETLGELAFSGFANLIGGTRGDVFGIVGDGGITGRIDGGLGEGVNLLDYSDSDGAVDVTLGDALSEDSVSITNINGVVGKNDGLSESAVNSTLSIADGNTDQSTWTIARHSDVPDSDGLNDGLVTNGDDTLYFVNFNVLNGGAGTDEFIFQNSGRLLGTLDGGAGTNTVTARDSTEDLSFSLKASPRADTYLQNIEEVMANTERTNILVAADQGNEWSITGADGSGSLKDQLRFSGFSELVGGTGADEFVLTGEGRVDHIDGGGSRAGEVDTVNLSEVNNPRTVSLDLDAADADLTLAHIDSVIAQSGAGHKLEGDDRENRWLVNGENSGSLNTQIDFAGFDYLQGNDRADTFALSGTGIVTGSLAGGDGDDTLDLVELDDGRTLTLSLTNRDGADLVFSGIEAVSAPTLAAHTLMASHDANEWKIDGANKGKLNQMSFTGVAHLIGGDADDRFEYQPAGSLSGRIVGGDHNEGDVLDASVLNTVEVVLGESGNVTGVETIIGNNRDTHLKGENLANTWRLTRGENAGTLNGVVSFAGVTDLAGGSEVDTFILNEGYVTGRLSGGAGNDVFELRLTDRSQGGLDLHGEAGEDQLLMTGGGSGYQAEYTVAGSDEQAMTYTGGANGSVFEVAFSGMHQVQDFTTADQLTLGGTLDADQLTLRDQSYQVNDLGELSYRNKTHLNIAAGSSDRLDIAGSLNVPGTLTIRNAAVTQSDPEALVSARAIRLTALESFGSRDQFVHTAVDTLSADIGRGGLFLQDSGALHLTDFTALGESALRAAGDISAERVITAGDAFGLQSERGGIRLSGDNQLSGQVNLQAQSDIVINNQRQTRLGTVEARSLDLTGSDSLTGGDRLVLEQLQLDIDGDVTLNHSDNAINQLRVTRSGAFNLVNGRELTVAELTSRGAASVQANGLTLDGPLSAQAARLDGGNAELVFNGRTEVDQELTGLGQGLELNAKLSASDVDLDGGSGALTLNAPVTASAEGRVALSGDRLVAGSDAPLVEAQRLEIRTRLGIGADARLNTSVSELHAANDSGDVRLRNTGELRVERLANNGDIDLVNEGTVQLDGRDGSVFERDNTDAIAAGGTANSNYELGSMVIEVLDGSLQALGQGHADRPDLVGRNATLLVEGNIGTEGRPLVMYIKNSLFMQGLRSLPPTWSFGHRPPSVEDNSSIQVSLQDLLRAGNEQMVEVESLEDINPAIFTEVRNYSFDEVSILMPPDQRYEDDEEERYSRGYSSN